MIYLFLGLIFWAIKTSIAFCILLISLMVVWRAYKILWARRAKSPVSGKDAVMITGATSGIGLALSKYLYKLGYSVVAGYYDSKETGYTQLKELRESVKVNSEQRIIFVEIDVRKQESISRAYSDCLLALKENNLRLYALINNASLGSLQPFAWLQRSRIENLVKTNLLGTLLVTREFLPLILKSKGRIVTVSSGIGIVPGPTYATYGITKHAQLYFTKCLNLELKSRYGIKFISVIPHNYIKSTNICAENVKTNESAWEELKEDEQKLYKEEYEEHCKMTRLLEKARIEHNKLVEKVQQQKRSSSSSAESGAKDDNQSSRKWTGIWFLVESIKEFVVRLQGENRALTLEESGALECFEYALRLDDPPEEIFAGDNIYNIFVGSLLLSLPSSFVSLLSSAISASLYK